MIAISSYVEDFLRTDAHYFLILTYNSYSDVILLPDQIKLFSSSAKKVLLGPREPGTAVEAKYQGGASQPR